jgi:mono/diheme cytochrome c family protein
VSTTVLVIGILAVAAVAVLGFFVLSASRSRRSVENVPPGMRPGYSDEQLERTVLERYMAWGLVLTVFFAVFFPVYWARETNRLTQATEQRFISQVVTGEALYVENCALCHGTDGGGGGAPSPYDAESIWPAPSMRNIVARYEDNPNVVEIEDFIEQTLHRGRPGTPMPAWGEIAGGPLTDEDIRDITLWILANQDDEELAEAAAVADLSGEELYQENCLKCHGPDLQGLDAGEGRPGVSLIGVLNRHSEESILGILRNGIRVPAGTMMPPWQEGYMYENTRFDDEALQRIIDYLGEAGGLEDDGGTAPAPEDGDDEDAAPQDGQGEEDETEVVRTDVAAGRTGR